MNEAMEKKLHEFSVKSRKNMNIQGIKEVESFDEQCVILQTTHGELTIEGSGLKVGTLDVERGIVNLTGTIDAVFYSKESVKEKKSIFGRRSR